MPLMVSNTQSVTEKVITAVAEREGVDEQDLRQPLYDVVDPDALDNIFRNGAGRVTFEYLGYDVVVTCGSDTGISITLNGGN